MLLDVEGTKKFVAISDHIFIPEPRRGVVDVAADRSKNIMIQDVEAFPSRGSTYLGSLPILPPQ